MSGYLNAEEEEDYNEETVRVLPKEDEAACKERENDDSIQTEVSDSPC
jgi:hypothetical protein